MTQPVVFQCERKVFQTHGSSTKVVTWAMQQGDGEQSVAA